MPLPANDSLVRYPDGTTSCRATVLAITISDDQALLLTDQTPFHPIDPRWPDQGADRGVLAFGPLSIPVVDCVVGATDGRDLFVGAEIPVRRGTPGWSFVVVHVLPADGPVADSTFGEGDEVMLTVDAQLRAQLSAGHTACHVASLALNAALADRWRKPVALDGLGRPNFDQLAIVSSKIVPDGAVDTYRVGKSLRKKGFDPGGLESALPQVVDAANTTLAGWLASAATVEVAVAGPRLTDLREWVCALPEGTVRLPCGGTHLHSLAEVTAIRVGLTFDEPAGQLVMNTSVDRHGEVGDQAGGPQRRSRPQQPDGSR